MRLASLAAAIVGAVMLFAPVPAAAQHGPDLAAQRAAIERLAGLVGNWQGEAQLRSPVQMTVHQTERVERDLDGLLIVVHGTGYANADHSGAPVFQAFAAISYDERRQIYEFRSYTRGYATTATGEFLDEDSFRWSIDAGAVKIRYTIDLSADTWREIGEMSRDGGATWTPTLEMTLRRIP